MTAANDATQPRPGSQWELPSLESQRRRHHGPFKLLTCSNKTCDCFNIQCNQQKRRAASIKLLVTPRRHQTDPRNHADAIIERQKRQLANHNGGPEGPT